MAIAEREFYRWRSDFVAAWYKMLLEKDFPADYRKGAMAVLKHLEQQETDR